MARGIRAITLPVAGREPRCVQEDCCSTQRKPPGRCVYLHAESVGFCSLYQEKLDKWNGQYGRCFPCLEARGDNEFDE